MKWSGHLCAAVMVASGCSNSSTRVAAPVTAETKDDAADTPRASRGPAFVVWTHGATEDPKPAPEESVWLDARGDVVARADGIVLAEGGRLWRWSIETKAVPFVDCDDANLDLDDPALLARAHWHDQEFQGASLVRLDASQGREILTNGYARKVMNLDQNPDGPRVGTFNESISVSGSVGPLLFVRDAAHESACGAHGLWITESIVVDIRTGARVSLTGTDQDAPQVLDATRAKLRAVYADFDPGSPQYHATEARVDATGLHMFHTFLADVPFAYGASPWRSYAVDTEVAAAVPPEVAPYTHVPAAVSTFAAAHPDLVLGGFTQVDEAEVERLGVAFAAR